MNTQIEYWNSEAGEIWAKEADALDPKLAPLGHLAMDVLGDLRGRDVLDVGCGAGATSRDLAERGADVTGVDVSRPLLRVARARGGATFIEADAATATFDIQFDALFSRFGVMFFDDPVAAFANLRRAMKPNGKLAFVCWAPMQLNSWAVEPITAVLPLLPAPPPAPDPDAPGPFAFAREGRALSLLAQAGWRDAHATLHQTDYLVGEDIEDALPLMLKIGPLGRLLRENPTILTQATEALRAVLAARAGARGVRFPAAVWGVEARA
jgi:SAM-dependent methyltransferase